AAIGQNGNRYQVSDDADWDGDGPLLHTRPPQRLLDVAIVSDQLLGAVHVDSPSSTRDLSATHIRSRSAAARASRSSAYSSSLPGDIPAVIASWMFATARRTTS